MVIKIIIRVIMPRERERVLRDKVLKLVHCSRIKKYYTNVCHSGKQCA